MTNATAVYIGKVVQPKKAIQENDNDRAHIDRDADHVITYLSANQEHSFLIDKSLRKDQGVTFDVFNDPEPSVKEEAAAEPELDEEGNPIVK